MRKDLVLLTAGRAAQALLAMAGLRLLTALLSPAQVGSVFLILSFGSWFGLFLISPVGNFINRRLHGWHAAGTLGARLRLFNLYVLAVALLALPLVFTCKVFLGVGAELPLPHFMAVMALYVYAVTWNQTAVPALNMLGRRGAFVGFSVLSAALGLLCSVLFSFYAGRTAAAWMYGQVAGFFIGYLAARAALRPEAGSGREVFAPLNRGGLDTLWAFAAPLSLSALLMWVQTQSYRVIVERFVGPEFLGYLVVGLGIAASLAGVTESIVQQLYFPGFYKKLHGASRQQRGEAISALAARAIPAYIVISVFVFALSGHLTRLLADESFRAAWKFAAAGAVIELFRMTANIYAAAAHAEMKTAELVKPYAWGGALTAGAVLAVCLSGLPPELIPACMAAGGLAALAVMKRSMQGLLPFSAGRAPALKGLLFSLAFLPALLVPRQDSLWLTLGLLAISGIYFLYAQWRLLGPGPAGAPGASPQDRAAAEAGSFRGEA